MHAPFFNKERKFALILYVGRNSLAERPSKRRVNIWKGITLKQSGDS